MAIASVKPAHTVEAPLIDPGAAHSTGTLERLGIRFTNWAERWFPDAFVFVALAVVVVALGALANGAPPAAVAKSFGDGFWSLITFTMQMALVTIGGYVVATSPPVARLIERWRAMPRSRARRGRLRGGATHALLVAQLGHEPDLRRPPGPRAGAARRICAWTTGPPARPPISASAPPGRWA